MTWAKSFREAYLQHFQCDSAGFERDLIRRGLHRRSLPISWAIWRLAPSYFEMELRTARYLGNAQSSQEFRAEIDSYRSDYRRHGGVMRNAFGVRLSGRRLTEILMTVSPRSPK